MSRKDIFHDTVVAALKKDGWEIVREQVRIIVDSRRLWIALKAQNVSQQQVILVEVKGFDTAVSQVNYLEKALGQYLLYRAIIIDMQLEEELYLAVPLWAFKGILNEKIGQIILQTYDVKLLIIDSEQEEVIQWKK